MKDNSLLFVALGIALGYFLANKNKAQVVIENAPKEETPAIGAYDVV